MIEKDFYFAVREFKKLRPIAFNDTYITLINLLKKIDSSTTLPSYKESYKKSFVSILESKKKSLEKKYSTKKSPLSHKKTLCI